MKYYVMPPPYERYFGGLEPPDYGSDVVTVEARTKREAKVLGLRELRRTGADWVINQQSDGRSPFAGLEVHTVEGPCCKWCDYVPDEFPYQQYVAATQHLIP